MQLHQELADFAGRNGWKPDFSVNSVRGNCVEFYTITWDFDDNEVVFDSSYYYYNPGVIYFETEADAKEAHRNILGEEAEFFLKYSFQQ